MQADIACRRRQLAEDVRRLRGLPRRQARLHGVRRHLLRQRPPGRGPAPARRRARLPLRRGPRAHHRRRGARRACRAGGQGAVGGAALPEEAKPQGLSRAPRHAAAGAVSAGQTARMAWPDGPSGA